MLPRVRSGQGCLSRGLLRAARGGCRSVPVRVSAPGGWGGRGAGSGRAGQALGEAAAGLGAAEAAGSVSPAAEGRGQRGRRCVRSWGPAGRCAGPGGNDPQAAAARAAGSGCSCGAFAESLLPSGAGVAALRIPESFQETCRVRVTLRSSQQTKTGKAVLLLLSCTFRPCRRNAGSPGAGQPVHWRGECGREEVQSWLSGSYPCGFCKCNTTNNRISYYHGISLK